MLVSTPHVVDFVRVLALAWKNLAAYPPGHPALLASLDQANARLENLRGPGGEIVLGIAADGLMYGDEKIDSPQARKLAQALYTRNAAVLRIGRRTQSKDLETFLRLLGGGLAEERRRPIWEELVSADVTQIELQPVDYSAVRVTDDVAEPPKQAASTLWEEILKALMNDKELTPTARLLLSSVRTIDDLAGLIMRHVNDAGRDAEGTFDPDATFGIKLSARVPETPAVVISRVAHSIGSYVGSSSGLRRQLAVQQIAQLLSGLPGDLRRSVIGAVLQALASDESAGSLLRELSASVSNPEMLDAFRAMPPGKLSTHALLLLQSLNAAGAPILKAPPVAEVVDELTKLFEQEDLDRYNPPDHRALLEATSIEIPRLAAGSGDLSRLGDRVETVSDESVRTRLARTLLDLLANHGTSQPVDGLLLRLENVFRSAVAAGQFGEALALIRELKRIPSGAAALQRMADVETVRVLIGALVSSRPERAGGVALLLDELGDAALDNLLVSLAEETNRSRRRKLFDFVSSLGPRIVPPVRRYLEDDRWYVVRNMILLLRGVNDRTALGDLHRLARHPDLRVRLEAIKALLALEPNVPTSLLENALHDPDPKLAETAIALVGSYGIREAVDPLLKILEPRDVFHRRKPLRLKVIKALSELAVPETLPRMRRFFSNSRLPWPAREERRAAYESLASYPPELRSDLVDRGRRSRDEQIREICRKLAGE